ncbi:hypothetical protein DFH09DRAFT_1179343 [Mycena vulgaris]|nr:hypothetical protein DFH09DRAFT_1179343 [Mycena vulgaris]
MAKRPASVTGMGSKGKGKGKEREMRRTVSFASSAPSISPDSVSSPDSNYSFASGSGDTSMTSPEADEVRRPTQDLMPPPPVPHERLPALDTNSMLVVPVTVRAQVKPAPERRVHPPPQPQPRAVPPNPSPTVQQPQQPFPQLPATRPPSSTKSAAAPEPRIHPLLQQPPTAAPPARAVPTTTRPAPTPAPAPMSQSQPQQRRPPPALGMRRTNTAPLAATSLSSTALSSSPAARKFRPPFRAPVAGPSNANVSAVQVKREAAEERASVRNPPVKPEPRVKTEQQRVKTEPRGQVQMQTQTRAAPNCSSPEFDFSFDEGTSFDLDALENVLKEYD